jgi:hypothetical protein
VGIMKNQFKRIFIESKEYIQTRMQGFSREKVNDILKNGLIELKEGFKKSVEKTSEKNWYYKATKAC